jgi:hypothetical protein
MNHPLVKHLSLGLATAALLCAQTSRADQQLTVPFGLPISINALVDETGCDNSPGPQITLSGDLKLGGVKARITLSNNAKGTHTTTVVGQFDVDLFLGGTIEIPKQPVLGGVGGNPLIYLQFTDGKGNNLSSEFFLGRCVQGLAVNADVINAALALLTLTASDCSNNPGPYITLGGEMVLSGLHAKIIFRNNVKGTHQAESTADVVIIGDNTPITIPKQPVLGGVGGNPLITIQLFHSDGTPINDPILLGRCVQL